MPGALGLGFGPLDVTGGCFAGVAGVSTGLWLAGALGLGFGLVGVTGGCFEGLVGTRRGRSAEYRHQPVCRVRAGLRHDVKRQAPFVQI